jgi:hypothetical protein
MGIDKLRSEDPEFRLIRVRPHGREGVAPVVNSGCPYQTGLPLEEHPFQYHCVSGSGGSRCEGYRGVVEVEGRTFTKCVESSRQKYGKEG